MNLSPSSSGGSGNHPSQSESQSEYPKDKDKDGNLLLTSSPTMYIQSSPLNDTVQCLYIITRSGFISSTDPLLNPSSIIDIGFVGVAVRAKLMTVITALKETFIYDLDKTRAAKSKPLRVELPLTHKDNVTVVCISDVLIVCGNETKAKAKHDREKDPRIGKYSLSLVGDSSGVIFVGVATREALFQVGSFKAHSSPIVAVATTGDPVRSAFI